jgi:hypothetical protein
MNVKMLEDAKYLQILTLLDDVEQSMVGALRNARHKQLWDEDEVPVEAWQGDIQTVMKLLDGHL